MIQPSRPCSSALTTRTAVSPLRAPQPPRPVRRRQRTTGFTLIEIILVVVIIGLLAALAVPSLVNALRGQQLDSAAHTLAVACQQARYEALFGGRPCWYVVDLDNQTVRLLQGPPLESNIVLGYELIAAETNLLDDASAEQKEYHELPPRVRIRRVQLETGEEHTSGQVGVPFYPSGLCEPFRLFLETGEGETRAVEVDMFTGKAKVVQPLE